jgi:hypothetical protein
VADEPILSLNDPSLIAFAVPLRMARATQRPLSSQSTAWAAQ